MLAKLWFDIYKPQGTHKIILCKILQITNTLFNTVLLVALIEVKLSTTKTPSIYRVYM